MDGLHQLVEVGFTRVQRGVGVLKPKLELGQFFGKFFEMRSVGLQVCQFVEHNQDVHD